MDGDARTSPIHRNRKDMIRINKSSVPEKYDSLRIDTYLSRRFNYLSRNRWQQEIIQGRVRYNGLVLTNYHRRVRSGDELSFSGLEIDEPEIDDRLNILYEDDHFVGIDKSGNLPVHPAGRFFNNTLIMILQERMRSKLYPLHRLDRETSGIILLAKSSEMASAVQREFHLVEKTYIALVHGIPEEWFSVDVPMGFDLSSPIRKKRAAYCGAPEHAYTSFKRILSLGDYSLVKAIPRTGRLHQIRVHLKYSGFPIVGDKLYGTDDSCYLDFIRYGYTDELGKRLLMMRSALHSRSIRFRHPQLKRTITVKAPLPEDMKEFIDKQGDMHG